METLTRSMINKFKEDLSLAVFTTKFVLEHNSPIQYVYHFEDGSWQFSGKETSLEDKGYKIVYLEEILVKDPTLGQLGDLAVGFEAVRSSKNDKWKIISSN